MSRDDLGAKRLICDENLKELALTAPGRQEEHLKACKKAAADQGNSTAVESIFKKIQNEARKKQLSQMKYSANKDRGGAVYFV